ncbi:MAG TPA: restriction endonuclease subunit S [Lutibacter sp.]|nr:restriction endonuclease subunit S [Lutibacter sp.]
MYGLKDKHIKAINSVFSKYPQIEKAILYGSRAKGNYRNGSDIDLTLVGNDLDLTTLFKIETKLDDLLLPYKMDLSILHKIENPDLVDHINRVGITFYLSAVVQADEKMASEWKEYILEDFAEINPTERLPKNTIAKKIAMEVLQPFTKRVASYSEEEYKGGTKFRNGDTIMARITPSLENGKTSFVDILEDEEIGFGSTEYIVFRERKDISDKDFIYYLTTSPIVRNTAIKSMTGSSGRQRVQTDVVKRHKILVPELPIQKQIAEILTSLDDKIDLLHRQNKTLETMAETLFREWFVENAEEEWEEGVLQDEFDFTMGQSPLGSTFNEDGKGTPMYQGNRDFEFRFPTNRVYTTDPKRFALKFDTLISVRAPVGAQNMANEKCCIGRGVAAFRYKSNTDFYTYTYFKMRSLMDEIKKFNDEGTVFGSIGKSDFEKLNVVIPPSELVEKYQNEVKPIDDKVILNCGQISKLEKLRDTLLPKLMSGEVKVVENE